jgi:hypothetical protein
MIGLFMYFVVAPASVWFYRDHLKHSASRLIVLGLIPLIGGLFMGVDFFYGLTNQTSIVRVVAIIILVVVFGLGFVIRAVRPNSTYFTEIKERRAQGIKGSDESGRTHDS